MPQLIICVGCTYPFILVRGREYCMECRPPVNRRPNYGQTLPPKRGRRPDYSSNDTKRNFQASTYGVLQEIIGKKKLSQNRSLASLCNDQTKPNNQLGHLLNSLLTKENQYIGFDLSEEVIYRNAGTYNQARWVIGDMCSEEGLLLMGKEQVRIIDYDACHSLKNKRVIKNLANLFQSTLLPLDVILMINIRVIGVRDKQFVNYDYWQFMDALGNIPGYKEWKLKWTDTYVSDQDGSTYRTMVLVRF